MILPIEDIFKKLTRILEVENDYRLSDDKYFKLSCEEVRNQILIELAAELENQVT